MYRILAIDDDARNLRLIEGFLESDEFHIIPMTDPKEGWEYLKKSYQYIDVVLLDRMMPHMDGIELMKLIKENPNTMDIPVIMQTAATEQNQVIEGIKAGVYYYLTKPYDEDVLLSIVQAAINDYHNHKKLREKVDENRQIFGLIKSTEVQYSTLNEARGLSIFLANLCPNPNRVVTGIAEILINAVEHGNLGLTYHEKSVLNASGEWEKEVLRRQSLAEYAGRVVNVKYSRSETEIELFVHDQGEGFDWSKYLQFAPERARDSHGRGIAIANKMCFSQIQYMGKGNEVKCTIPIPKQTGKTG